MATYIANATGNWDAANIWSTVDSTSVLDSEANNTALTTSFVSSSAFTPGAITIDGIAVKVASIAASPTGTISVQLAQGGSLVTGTLVTINVSDIHQGDSTANGGCGWFLFKFSSVLLLTATAYTVQAKTSSSSQVNLYRDATSNNWSRMLRTTTAGTPTTNDLWHILGEKTGAGTQNARTITYNQTATTSFGKVTVGSGGTFTLGTASSTAYYLKLAGILRFTGGAATSPGRLATSSSFVLEFNCAGNVDFGLEILSGSSVAWPQGASKTSVTYMTSDLAAAGTALVVNDTTGWQNNDTLCFAAQNLNTAETKTISTVNSSTSVTISAGLTNAHSGTNSGGFDTRNHVGNLTRNMIVRGISSSLCGYVYIGPTATVTFDEVEFNRLGSSTANKRGVDVQTTTGSSTFTDCSFHDFKSATNSEVIVSGSASNNFTFTNCIAYNNGANGFDLSAATTGTAYSFTGCMSIKNGTNGFNTADVGAAGGFVNCISSGNTSLGFTASEAATMATGFFTGLISHSNNGSAQLNWSNCTGGLGLSATVWGGNGNNGFGWGSGNSGTFALTLTAFGDNGGANCFFNSPFYGILYLTLTADKGPGTAGSSGTSGNAVSNVNFNDVFDALWLMNSLLSTNSAVTTADIVQGSVHSVCFLKNTKTSAATPVSGQTNIKNGGGQIQGIYSDDDQQVSGAFKRRKTNGTITRDTTIQDSGKDTFRATPTSSTLKLRSIAWQPNVNNATTPTVTVKVRCSVVGDGTAYNGNRPRLILLADPGMGYGATDTVLATATSASNGAFETLSAALPASASRNGCAKVYVDCDGTTGWVNIATTPTTT